MNIIRWIFTVLTALILTGGSYLVWKSSDDLLTLVMIPLVIIGGMAIWMWVRPHNSGLHIAGIALLVVLLFVAVASFISASMFQTETSNVRKYDAVMKRWHDNPLLAHFPRPIPTGATDVQFFYQTTLGAGSDTQLAYTTTQRDIDALYQRFSRIKTTSITGLKDHEWPYPIGILATAKGQPPIFPIPADYEVMAFDQLPPGRTWDRLGKGHGVMISRQRHRIVYWAQYWDAPDY